MYCSCSLSSAVKLSVNSRVVRVTVQSSELVCGRPLTWRRALIQSCSPPGTPVRLRSSLSSYSCLLTVNFGLWFLKYANFQQTPRSSILRKPKPCWYNQLGPSNKKNKNFNDFFLINCCSKVHCTTRKQFFLMIKTTFCNGLNCFFLTSGNKL